MSVDVDRLYNLLPAIYRIRDSEQGGPLKALLTVFAEQIGVVADDLGQLYNDQFIETCAPWVVPYIGDLIGVRALHGNIPRIATPRAEVANTIGYRRRKGTALMLQQLAHDVTGWDARVVEFFELLAATQYMNHLRPDTLSTPDLRVWEPLERLNTAFDSVSHIVDVRRIASGRGRYNIPNVGIFLFRLGSYSLTGSPAYKLDATRYLFSPLGNDTPLFNMPQTLQELTYLADPIDVPMPISRRVLDAYLNTYYGDGQSSAFGDGRSIFLVVDGQKIPLAQIVVCDLSDVGTGWAHQPNANAIAIDPVLGRIAFSSSQPPMDLQVTFHYGFSAPMGGGEYERASPSDPQLQPVLHVPARYSNIQSALTALTGDGVVEIDDSGRYVETPSITVGPNQRVEVCAADQHRSTVVLGGDLQIQGGDGAQLTLNGLLMTGGTLRVQGPAQGEPFRVRLMHCTLVPGLRLAPDGTPQQPSVPSIVVGTPLISLVIDHCIVGGLQVVNGASVGICDSIVDATAEDAVAYVAPLNPGPGATLSVKNTTIVGKVWTTELELATNTIFLARLAAKNDTWAAPVLSDRRQEGCVRFSFVPLEARVPRRYHCQPETADDAARVRPQLTSLRFGDPGYCQLSRRCASEIREGADDEAEMGAFHDLYQPQRETNLRVRLDEYLRFGLEAGILYAT